MNVTIRSYRKEREGEILSGLQAAMVKACVLVQNDAKKNIIETSAKSPWKKTGQIASAINNVVTVDGDAIVGEIGIADSEKAKVGKYLELGHIQHPGQYVEAIGKRLVAGEVSPYPWLFPALESNRDKIIELLRKSSGKGISITGGQL